MSTLLEHLLTARINLLLAARRTYKPGCIISQEVVTTNRLILLHVGSLQYDMEEHRQNMQPGDLWLVPSWTRRSWQAIERCELAWVEFVIHPIPANGLPAMHLPAASPHLTQGLTQTLAYAQDASLPNALLAEMSLKHLLAQMLAGQPQRPQPSRNSHDLSQAIELLRAQMHERDALQRMFEQSPWSPARLRTRFRAVMGIGPADYLQTLRMQQARHLLLTTDLNVKEVARRVGYEDPLYFSRRYRLYWRKAPREDRAPNP